METTGKGEGGREEEEDDDKFSESRRRLNKYKNDKLKKTKIERKEDGEKKFKVVGRMGGKGTVIKQKLYFFLYVYNIQGRSVP
jgi:hypothetical protein